VAVSGITVACDPLRRPWGRGAGKMLPGDGNTGDEETLIVERGLSLALDVTGEEDSITSSRCIVQGWRAGSPRWARNRNEINLDLSPAIAPGKHLLEFSKVSLPELWTEGLEEQNSIVRNLAWQRDS
jgi:hypothetical protein